MFEFVQKHTPAIARDGLKVRRLIGSCRKLLSERGEAAGVSLAKSTLDLYRALDRKTQDGGRRREIPNCERSKIVTQ